MKTHRRTVEEWRLIIERQKEQNQTDSEYAQSQGLGVASLRAWRAKFKNQESAAPGTPIIEVTPLAPSSVLRVLLPNGIRLEVTVIWPMEHLGRVVQLLRSL